MKIPPQYRITSEILSLISKIDANLLYLSSLTISGGLKEKIKRTSLLKSSLFSARIEGNTETLETINKNKTNLKKIKKFLTSKSP